MIVEVESDMLEGYVTKWAPKYAFAHASVLPQIKLLGNNCVAELKFMHLSGHSGIDRKQRGRTLRAHCKLEEDDQPSKLTILW